MGHSRPPFFSFGRKKKEELGRAEVEGGNDGRGGEQKVEKGNHCETKQHLLEYLKGWRAQRLGEREEGKGKQDQTESAGSPNFMCSPPTVPPPPFQQGLHQPPLLQLLSFCPKEAALAPQKEAWLCGIMGSLLD